MHFFTILCPFIKIRCYSNEYSDAFYSIKRMLVLMLTTMFLHKNERTSVLALLKSFLPFLGFCAWFYTLILYKSIRISFLRMLLLFYYIKTIHKWIIFEFFSLFSITSTFFWYLRMVQYSKSIKKHTHFLFAYAFFVFSPKNNTQMDNYYIFSSFSITSTFTVFSSNI